MNYNKKTVKDIDVAGKKVLLRCDFNVPQDKATGAITDDKRIVAALPTIQYLLEQNAAVIACSHLGKPKEGPDPKFSLAPVAKRLSELLGKPVNDKAPQPSTAPLGKPIEDKKQLTEKLSDALDALLHHSADTTEK